MASGKMVTTHIPIGRYFSFTDILSIAAAGVENTAGRRIERTGDIPF